MSIQTSSLATVFHLAVPVRHFGAILAMAEWGQLAARLQAAGVKFIIEPQIRFKGLVGDPATMFFPDPSGNALEFKSFADPSQLFAKVPQNHPI